MAPTDAAALRFIPTTDRLDDLFRRYEDVRRRSGIATTLARISPQQRIDAIVAMLGLNAASGWHRMGSESAEDLWLRYLTPVLAETRESAAALDVAARNGLPGRFEPEIESHEPEAIEATAWSPEFAEEAAGSIWRRRLAFMLERSRELIHDRRALAALAMVILCVAGLAAIVAWLGQPVVPGPVSTPIAIQYDPATPSPTPMSTGTTRAVDQAGADYRVALAITLAGVEDAKGTLTPRDLAEIYAGSSSSIVEPAIFLGEMFRQWPLPPDIPITRDRAGAFALTRYAETFAAIERHELVPVLRPALDQDTPDDQRLRDAVTQFADGSEVNVTGQSADIGWLGWLPWLAFLPLIPVLVWTRLTTLPAFKAVLTNPAFGARGVMSGLPVESLIMTAPAPARRLARQISWREPGFSRRIHAEASVRATIRHGGFLTLVPRRRRRTADYLFLVPRLRRNDHERDRVSRFIDALKRGGLSLDVYDYDPDPRTLYPRQPSGDDEGLARTTTLDLRALRERHAEARLVLVTDGAELVDYFTQRALPFVAEELASWPARMLLTPVPMAEWGERELNLAEALGAIVGRATPESFGDLASVFGDRPPTLPRPVVSSSAGETDDDRLMERLVGWLDATEAILGRSLDVERRPAILRFDDPILRSDAVPPDPDQESLITDLRTWLGPRGFYWLAACAAYPELRFAITLYLGLKLTIDRGPILEPLYDERLLAQLTLLPWFRIGRMPPWLRRALFAALPEPARKRIRAAVDEMLNSSPLSGEGLLPRDAHLAIWRPDSRGLDVPPDAVMADLMFRDMSEVTPVLRGGAFSRVFRDAILQARRARALVLGITFVWCLAAWLLWPTLGPPPRPAGIWLPLLSFVGVTLAVALSIALARFWRNYAPTGLRKEAEA